MSPLSARSESELGVSKPHFLYRWFDKDDVLLYIGISANPVARRKGHETNSWWSHWGTRFTAESDACAFDKDGATLVEARAITAERPVFNKIGAAGSRERIAAYLVSRGHDPAEYERRLPPPPKVKARRRHAGRPEIGPRVETRLPQDVIDDLDRLAAAAEMKRADFLRELIITAMARERR